MSHFFFFGNFSKIQPFSLPTYIDFSEKLFSLHLFTPDSSWMASWYTNHLCTVTKLPCQNIHCVFFFQESRLSFTQFSKTYVAPLCLTSPLPRLSSPTVFLLHYTPEQSGEIPGLSLVRVAVELEAAQLLSCGIASGFPVLLLSSAAGGYTAFVS